LKLLGEVNGCCYQNYVMAYSIIDMLFPGSDIFDPKTNLLIRPSLGYTDNFQDQDPLRYQGLSRDQLPLRDLRPVLRSMGDLNLLHATIKTLQSTGAQVISANGTPSTVEVGGDITVLGPGGSIDVGTTALEINRKLSNSSLGVLTLDNGAINIFTDTSVLVNQSRILTVQGGDILMLSSNGDLDAGRGAKTTVDFKPLSVNFDPAALQTINLNGLVSGAGIGTIRSTPDAPAASAVIIAPRGVINAGDAGLRSSGSISLVALQILNAANVTSLGPVNNNTVVSGPSIGELASTGATAGQAARAGEDATAAASRGSQAGARNIPSLITVEVLGFGDCDPESGRSCPTH